MLVVLHQEVQSKLDHTLQQIEQHNVMILALVRRIQSAQHTLQSVLSDADDKLAISRRAGEGSESPRACFLDLAMFTDTHHIEPLDYKNLLSYARRVANTTSAPPTGTQMPPIPQDADMKMSRLFWKTEDLINGKEELQAPGNGLLYVSLLLIWCFGN